MRSIIGTLAKSKIVLSANCISLTRAEVANESETKREAEEERLKLLIIRNKRQAVRDLRGKLKWEGNLHEMRGTK